MTAASTFSESMFVLVSKRADGNWYPVALQDCLLLFTTGEAAKTFLSRVEGIPDGSIVSQESGWNKVIGVMQLARDEGVAVVAVDPTETAKTVRLDESIRSLEQMVEQ